MIARIVVTLVVLGFAIGAFCGAGPTRMGLFDPFGILFLFVAAFVWFKWDRLKAGFDRAVMDDIAQSYWRPDGSSGPKVPEQDRAVARRRPSRGMPGCSALAASAECRAAPASRGRSASTPDRRHPAIHEQQTILRRLVDARTRSGNESLATTREVGRPSRSS